MGSMKNLAALASALLLPLAIACGRAPAAPAPEFSSPAPATPAEAEEPTSLAAEEAASEPTTLAEAEALLEKARADLDRLALNEPGAPSPTSAGAAPPAAAPRQERAAEDSADAAPTAQKKAANACETACKAFSSLERASEAVCRLDTDPSAKRCERAKQIREDAARRVLGCNCSQ